MKRTAAMISILIVLMAMAACGRSISDASGEEHGKTIEEPDISSFSGLYRDEDLNEIVVWREDDTVKMEVAIYRLTSLESENVYSSGDGIAAETTDAAGKPLKFLFYPEGDSFTLEIAETTWEYFIQGQKFTGFKRYEQPA